MPRPNFPMVARELTLLARAPHLYILRTACIVLALLPILAYQLASTARAQRGVPLQAETLGGWLVSLCTYFHIFVFCLVVPLSTAGLIAAERRDRTLPLLLLADRRGWDLAASKFCAALLPPVYLILATLPLTAFAAFFGGISASGIALQIPFAIAVSLAVGCIGLLCSALTIAPQRAFAATIAVLGVWVFGFDDVHQFLTGSLPFTISPMIIRSIHEVPAIPNEWTPALALPVPLALCVGALAFLAIPRAAYERPIRHRRHTLARRLARQFLPLRPGPHLLVSRTSAFTPTTRSPYLRSVVILGLFGIALIPGGFGWAVILCVISFTTVTTVAAVRKNGLLEDLLVTPMDSPGLAQSLIRAGIDRATICLLPLALSGGLYLYTLFTWTNLADTFTTDGLNTLLDYAYWLGVYAASTTLIIALLILQLFCIVTLATLAGSFRAPVPLLALGVITLYTILFFFACRLPLRLMTARQSIRTWDTGLYDDYLGVLGFTLINLLAFGGVGLLAYNELRDRVRTEFTTADDAPGVWTPHHYYRRGPIAQSAPKQH